LKSPVTVLVLIVLADLMGFSLVIPLLPPIARQYGASPVRIGLLMAAYPFCQLLAAPILGRLSDRYGRRPVLIASQAGTALSFLILGLTRDFTVILLARGLDGASGGNFLVAQAYIADVTRPEDRAKGYGMLGAAFGVGFVLGPILGASLLALLPEDNAWRLRLPFLAAAAFSTLAWVLVLVRLPESLPPGGTRQEANVLSWRGILDTVSDRSIGLLVLTGSLSALGFSGLEGTFSLFLQERLGWGPDRQVLGYAFVGLLIAVVQGGLIRHLVPLFGEARLMLGGLCAVASGLAGMALVPQGAWPVLFAAVFVTCAGQAVANPSLQGLLSRLTPASEQGAVFGVYASAQTLCRMLNYLVANVLLGLNASFPYWEASTIVSLALLVAAGWAWSSRGFRFGGPPSGPSPDSSATPMDLGSV
jgi:DHA1 family tetracycline resistance protein-like MFS transporter